MSRSTVVIELAENARFARDLAAGGVFVPGCALALAEECDLVVCGAHHRLRVPARVVYVEAHRGAGLELVGFSTAMKAQLAELAPGDDRADDDDREHGAVDELVIEELAADDRLPDDDDPAQGAPLEALPLSVPLIDVEALAASLEDDSMSGYLSTRPPPDDPGDRDSRDNPDEEVDEDDDLALPTSAGDPADADLGDARAIMRQRADARVTRAIVAADILPPGAADALDRDDPDGRVADGDDVDTQVDGDREGPRPGRTQTARNVHERLRGLNLAAQIKLAGNGELHERIVLERLYGKNVWETLLRNPRLTPPEIARIARYGSLPRVLIEIILSNNAWLQVPEVRRALLSNPRLATDQIVKVLRLTPKHELKLAAIQTAYPHAVRNAAKMLLRE